MRRLSPAAAVACVAVLAGCGRSHAKHATTAVQMRLGRVYAVQVYFCTKLRCPTDVTRSQERLGMRLRSEPCVRQLIFISKDKALALVKKESPTLYQALPPGVGNPLPDSFEVTPDKPSRARAIAAAARAAHWPGIQQVVLNRRPATRVGS